MNKRKTRVPDRLFEADLRCRIVYSLLSPGPAHSQGSSTYTAQAGPLDDTVIIAPLGLAMFAIVEHRGLYIFCDTCRAAFWRQLPNKGGDLPCHHTPPEPPTDFAT